MAVELTPEGARRILAELEEEAARTGKPFQDGESPKRIEDVRTDGTMHRDRITERASDYG